MQRIKKPFVATEEPIIEKTVYGVYDQFFDTVDEAKGYCKQQGISFNTIDTLNYVKTIAGRYDVIYKVSYDGSTGFYTAVDEDGYGIYNPERSSSYETYIWEFQYGQIRQMYQAFRERGICFHRDIYAEIEERNHHIMQLCSNHNLFHCQK